MDQMDVMMIEEDASKEELVEKDELSNKMETQNDPGAVAVFRPKSGNPYDLSDIRKVIDEHKGLDDGSGFDLSAIQNVLEEKSICANNEGKQYEPQHVISFVDDNLARTNDPKVMERNYRFPVIFVPEYKNKIFRHGGELIRFISCGTKAEITVSREFLEGSKSDGVMKYLESGAIERYRGYNQVKGTDIRSVIKRSRVPSCNIKVAPGVPYRNELRRLDEKSKAIGNILRRSNRIIAMKRREQTRKDETPMKVIQFQHDTIVAVSGTIRVQLQSLKSLKPKAYVNDEIFEYGLLQSLGSCPSHPGIVYTHMHSWQSYWHQKDPKATVDRYFKSLCKRCPGGDLLKIKFLIIPAFVSGHWFLAFACNPFPDVSMVAEIERKARDANVKLSIYSKLLYFTWITQSRTPPQILIFDSLYPRLKCKGVAEIFHSEMATCVTKALLVLHEKLWTVTKRDIVVEIDHYAKVIMYKSMVVPGQSDKFNCGIFCMNYLKMWITEMSKANFDYMKLYYQDFSEIFKNYQSTFTREKMLQEIYNNCLTLKPESAEAVKQYTAKYCV